MNALRAGVAPFALLLPGMLIQATDPADGLFISHVENILGTSFDMNIVARSYAAARQAETVALSEIERLSAVLSSYRPDSEFSRWLLSGGQTIRVSPDLLAVLNGFDYWRQQTGGAINAAAETINQLWQQAAASQTALSSAERTEAVTAVQKQHWQLNVAGQTATRLSDSPLRLHTFAKSYVLDRAANIALTVAGVRAVVLNIGGDLVVQGDWTETIAVANPRADAENDRPLARLSVQNRAVATSGDYRRGVWVNGTWHSHIIDPRTGLPAREVISATVVHPDATTAGALATAFNVLSPAESERLAANLASTEYLITTQNGQHIASPGWNQLLYSASTASPLTSVPENASVNTVQLLSVSAVKDKLWDPNQELLISLELSRIEGRSHRPFVAAWVEDEEGKPVRQLALWYNKPRWLHDLREWYNLRVDTDVAASVTSATRSPGTYTLVWDGKDDKGQFVKQGKYTVMIEAAREHGTYQLIRQVMDFNGKPKQQTLNGNVEITAAALDYREKTATR